MHDPKLCPSQKSRSFWFYPVVFGYLENGVIQMNKYTKLGAAVDLHNGAKVLFQIFGAS